MILFASTHGETAACPPVPDREKIKKYVWPLYDSYEIYVADMSRTIKNNLPVTNTTIGSHDLTECDKIIFTSTRDGDLDLYTMNMDGSDIKRITNELGYDGGAWFSPDGTKIVWRASPEDRR
jgi:tricorn protease-like protein